MEGGADHDQEEIDTTEKVNVAETSAARSYDCMYCKRGFSTAQALGGHMNIHRRDRARVRESFAAAPPTSPLVVVTAAEEELVHHARYAAFGPPPHKDLKPLFPLVSEPCRPPPHPMFQPSSSTSSSWEERRQAREDVDPAKREELKIYGKDLELGYKNVDQTDQQEENDNQSEKENLNLRLGL